MFVTYPSLNRYINEFVPIAGAELQKMDVEFKDMQKAYNDLGVYYGEEAGSDIPNIMFEFVNQFNVSTPLGDVVIVVIVMRDHLWIEHTLMFQIDIDIYSV